LVVVVVMYKTTTNLKKTLTPQKHMVHYEFAYPNHVVLDLYGCDEEKLNNLDLIMETARTAARRLRSEIVGEVYHLLEPQGVIYTATLLQSHIAVHTWPELGYASVDIYTCSDVSVRGVEELFIKAFAPKNYKVLYLNREVSREPTMDMLVM